MKTPKHLITLLIVLSMSILGACENFLDVNNNPNDPENVPENLQLSGMLANFSYQVIGNEPARTPSQWMQQTAWNGVQPSVDTYDLDDEDVNNLWEFFSYSSVMNNAQKLDLQATENGNFAYAGIAKIIKAWNLGIITDVWGDAPYSEAFDPANTKPKYDTQEEIYASIQGLLDDAIEDLDKQSPMTPGMDDLLYGGDLGKWKKLAYVVKARFHIHLTKAPNNTASNRAQLALNALGNAFASNADDADFTYFDKTGEENPWFQFAIDGKWDTRNQLSFHYVDMLKNLGDPRLKIQARPRGALDANGEVPGFDYSNTNDTMYVGHINGEEGIGAINVSSIGRFYSDPDAPLNWISYAEAKFIEAEARLILNGPSAAQPVYIDAITASMDKLGVTPAERDAYINSLPQLNTDNALRQIMIQKYIANFLSLEIYNDWRRNGYPELEPITNNPRSPGGVIPTRYPYPSSEVARNRPAVDATGVGLGIQALDERVWWDVD